MTKKYYDEPTMVRFLDEGNEGYDYGIAFGEKIVCACCGGVLEQDDLLFVEELGHWIDFDYAIRATD